MLTIYSIIPSLKNELGHFFEYNLALTKASKLNSFKHIKIIPKTSEIPENDDSWQKVIHKIDHDKKWKNIRNISCFIKVFKKIKKEKKAIIFLEDFNLIILILILIASIIVRPKADIWLFHRFEYEQYFLKGKVHKLIQFILEKIFSKKRIKYLTDSDLIKKINERIFNRTFHIFPIPHVYFSKNKKETSKQFKYYWWPGGLIRKEKGLENIKKLIKFIKDADNIKIVLAQATKGIIQNNNVIYIPTNLTRNEYEKWMVFSEIILLPYVSNLYRYRTSGIFVEAIVAGSIPVVSKDTWMAYELQKYDLNELILDWDSSTIIENLKIITKDTTIKKKLTLMKEDYRKFHSVENYASIMKSLLN